jgi:RimJ/RimL family protein N-acetyltransferase
LNRVFLKVLETNFAAIKLYESAGFKKEGLLQESVYKNNSFHNELVYGILKREFNG